LRCDHVSFGHLGLEHLWPAGRAVIALAVAFLLALMARLAGTAITSITSAGGRHRLIGSGIWLAFFTLYFLRRSRT
jgi:hypothetical protein